MPTQKLTQTSFVSGQYDRTAQNQEGMNNGVVASGLSYSRNLLSSDKHEIRKRLGTKRMELLGGTSVIAPYRYGEDDILLVFSDKKLDLYSYQGDKLLPFVGSNNLVKFEQTWTANTTNGYTVADSDGADDVYKIFTDGIGIPSNNGYYITFEVPESVSINKFYFNFTARSNGAGGAKGFRNAVIFWSDDGKSWTPVDTAITKPDGTPGISTGYGKTGGAVKWNLWWIEYNASPTVASSHKYWKVVFDEYQSSDAPLGNLTAEFWVQSLSQAPSQSTEIAVDSLQKIKYDQFGQNMKIVSKGGGAYSFSIKGGVISFDTYKPTQSGLLPTDLPSCVAYFQNRLWFSGYGSNAQTVYSSKFGIEDDFRQTDTAQFDDALKLTCNQLKNSITNILGSQSVLYCFSEDGISFVDGGSGGIVATNQNVEFNLKNRMPAGDATPTFKDDILLYASSDGTKLYAVDYDLIVSRFQVEDLAKYAKDITFSKIKAMHYLNNVSQLVYSLCEDGTMFALMYKKGVFNGFFPIEIQDGYVYDMCPMKVGRDYKLLMVTNRSGHWYLEEKLDSGKYIDTSSILMSKEDKKWATYDNLENNIALDCYSSYSNQVVGGFEINGDVLKSDVDLSAYINKSIMFGTNNSFLIVNLISGSKNTYKIERVANRGNSSYFSVANIGFESFQVDFAAGTEIGVISQGRYMGEFIVPEDGIIELPFTVHKVIYGATYLARGIIRVEKPYESMKQVQQMAFSVLNTAHLEVGTSLDYMVALEKIKDDSHLDLTNITMNGNYVVVPSDTPEWEKNIIFQSRKGLPFTLCSVEALMKYSNMGGK